MKLKHRLARMAPRFIEMYESGMSLWQIAQARRKDHPWLNRNHVDAAIRAAGYKRKMGRRLAEEHKKKAAELYALYRRLKSCAKVARAWSKKHQRMTRQSVQQLMRSHGYQLNPRVVKMESQTFDGIVFARHVRKDGTKYWRETRGQRRAMHRVVWEKANGPIPLGFEISFIDGDSLNCELSNLVLKQHEGRMQPDKACAACKAKMVPKANDQPWDFNNRLACSKRCSRILAGSALALRKMTCHWPHHAACVRCKSREIFPLKRVSPRQRGDRMEYWVWCPSCRSPFRMELRKTVPLSAAS